ncbi:MAG: S1C family serine protease [Gemmatimonadota bacterium]|nr:S1C family serine protease [Gemmatimonadota bacterium]
MGILFFGAGVTDCRAGSVLRGIEEERAEILEKNRAGVVRIHAMFTQMGTAEGLQYGKGFMHGTGFVLDSKGTIVTVLRAVKDADEISVILGTGRRLPARFVASDPVSEVAVIRVETEGLQPVVIGNSDRVRVGHYAFILGNSFGELKPSFGYVFNVDRTQDLIHIAAPVHLSFGGAPVFCSSGKILGLVWALPDPWSGILPEGVPGARMVREYPTTVFVVPVNRAVRIAQRLLSGSQTVYGWLGVTGEYDADYHGVRVDSIAPNGPAASSGIVQGDLIISFQEQQIQSAEHLQSLVLSTTPGTEVRMKIKRGEQPDTPRVEVGKLTVEPGQFPAAGFDAFAVTSQLSRQEGNQALYREFLRLQREMQLLKQQMIKKPAAFPGQ